MKGINTKDVKTDSKFASSATVLVVFLLVFLIGFLNIGKLVTISIIKGDDYRTLAENTQLKDTKIQAERGTIYDANLKPLVNSVSSWTFACEPKSINKLVFTRDKVANDVEIDSFIKYLSSNLAEILGMEQSEIKDLMSGENAKKTYAKIKKGVLPSVREKLENFLSISYEYKDASGAGGRNSIIPSTYFIYENDSIRIYPQNSLAASVLGVVNADNAGVSGVEKTCDNFLSGEPGRMFVATDSWGNAFESSYESVYDATQGSGVVLTIDATIQEYLENGLMNSLNKYHAKSTFGIVMEVDTGKILAMANVPSFDSNNPREITDDDLAKAKIKADEYCKEKKIAKDSEKYKETYNGFISQILLERWGNYCVTDAYEPGSTFKIFTASAALEENVVNLNTTYTCNGSYKFSHDTIHCSRLAGHGTQTLTQGLMNSCNPFFIDIGQKVGKEKYFEYFEAFGFTEKTGIDLPNETNSVYHTLNNMGEVELASTSFGQTFTISPIQLITATCAIGNGGKLMEPYIIDSVVDTELNIIEQFEPKVRREVISEQTAKTVREMMEAVVESGTGKQAYRPGYRIAGKTATSEKLDPDSKKDDDYIGSFVCFAPADDPKIAILMGADEPKGAISGSEVAAPYAGDVMQSILKYLNIEPKYSQQEWDKISTTAPNFKDKTVSEAYDIAYSYGFKIEVSGDGNKVKSQVPEAGTIIKQGSTIVITTK